MNLDEQPVLDDRNAGQLRQAGVVDPARAQVLDDALAQLREAIAEEQRVETSGGLSPRRRRRGWAVVATAGAGIAAAAALLITAPWVTQTQTPAHVATGVGPLAGATTASCAQVYSPQMLEQRSFGFDGTVTKIHTWGKTQVTFHVDEWFRGGSGEDVTVTMPAPVDTDAGQRATSDEQLTSPNYSVGTRLLVSGSFSDKNTEVSDAFVFGCGFTRYFDEATAAQWASVLGS